MDHEKDKPPRQIIRPMGIPSAEAFGTATVAASGAIASGTVAPGSTIDLSNPWPDGFELALEKGLDLVRVKREIEAAHRAVAAVLAGAVMQAAPASDAQGALAGVLAYFALLAIIRRTPPDIF